MLSTSIYAINSKGDFQVTNDTQKYINILENMVVFQFSIIEDKHL